MQLSKFLHNWNQKASEFTEELHTDKSSKIDGGLVIGLTASRIISNVLLQKWDRLVREKITPIHYGRYVDDMFLVMHDPGNINSSENLMEFFRERLGNDVLTKKEDDFWEINLGKEYQAKSRIQLQSGKQKLFILEGQGGLDLLDSIEKEIVALSSECRLMPSPDQLERSTAARVLSAAGEVGEHADTLRRADGLTIRRLSWSLQLRHVEVLANDLPPGAWKTQREEFYTFAHNHILRPEKLFAHFTYLPRLLGFAIGLNEWEQAEAIVRRSLHGLKQLEEAVDAGSNIVINGTKCHASKNLWRYAKGSLIWTFVDAAAKNYPIELLFDNKRNKRVRNLANVFMSQLWEEFTSLEKELTSLDDLLDIVNSVNFDQKAPLLASTDLARKPYKQILASADINGLLKLFDNKKEARILMAFKETKLLDTNALTDFLNRTRQQRLSMKKDGPNKDGYRAYLFPTRPYTPSEIAELDPRCVGLGDLAGDTPQTLWAKYVCAIRGVWVKPLLLDENEELQSKENKKKKRRNRIHIGTQQKDTVIVAISNISMNEDCWAASASGKSKLTLSRYKSIAELVNQAIKLYPKPDYLIFPELSIPLEWVDSVAKKLISSGISLIAGTEYRHLQKEGEIFSEACLELIDDRLGFPSSVRILQPKLEPAVGEDKELISKYALKWRNFPSKTKPIYKHNGFHFGVMICSELQNSKARIQFQGFVDALMVLCWNQDLDTFSALTESAALDIHAYTILVNNRKYGDSRVRSPAKESFKRDMARLRGGENDFCVSVKLDITKLRAFQSRAKRWPEENDPFKPVPEGFDIAAARKIKPPK